MGNDVGVRDEGQILVSTSPWYHSGQLLLVVDEQDGKRVLSLIRFLIISFIIIDGIRACLISVCLISHLFSGLL